MKNEQTPTPEEMAKIHEKRIKSDANLISGGAKIKTNEKGEVINLEPTEEQMEKINFDALPETEKKIILEEKKEKEKAEEINEGLKMLKKGIYYGLSQRGCRQMILKNDKLMVIDEDDSGDSEWEIKTIEELEKELLRANSSSSTLDSKVDYEKCFKAAKSYLLRL